MKNKIDDFYQSLAQNYVQKNTLCDILNDKVPVFNINIKLFVCWTLRIKKDIYMRVFLQAILNSIECYDHLNWTTLIGLSGNST